MIDKKISEGKNDREIYDFLNKKEVQQVIMALMLIPMAASKLNIKVPQITMPNGKTVDAQSAAQQLGLEKVVDKDGNFIEPPRKAGEPRDVWQKRVEKGSKERPKIRRRCKWKDT